MATLFEVLAFSPDYRYVVSVLSDANDAPGIWCTENIEGLWTRDVDLSDHADGSVERFYFEDEKDFVAFTLKWA